MPLSRGMTGSKWFECSICGFDYPVKYRRFQDGKPRCTYLPCYDKRLDQEEGGLTRPQAVQSLPLPLGDRDGDPS